MPGFGKEPTGEEPDIESQASDTSQRETGARDYGDMAVEQEAANIDVKDMWGSGKFNGKWRSIYNDPEIIRHYFTDQFKSIPGDQLPVIADFGGAEGSTLNVVYNELRQRQNNLLPVNIDLMQDKIGQMIKNTELAGVVSDLKSIPLKESSVSNGILRFVLPYFSKEGQKRVLGQVYKVLKPKGRVIILQDGADSQRDGTLYDQLFKETDQAQEKPTGNRYFASREELDAAAESVGFNVPQARPLYEIEAYLSPEAYSYRFDPKNEHPEHLSRMKEVYEKWSRKEEMRDKFVTDLDSGTIRVKRPLIYLVLEKPEK